MKGSSIPWLLAVISLVHATSNDKRPHFVVEPPSRLAWPTTKGAHAACRATGHPNPDVHWITSEGQLLTTIPGLRHVLSDGRLVLGARKSMLDAGGTMLRCRASNTAGVVLSRPMLIQSVDDSVMVHMIKQLTPAKVGGTVVLQCEVSIQLGAVDITWLQDGLPLPAGYMAAADSRWVSGAGGILFGSDLTQADLQADYSCLALDFSSQPVKLATDDGVWIDNYQLNNIEASVDDTLVLPCLLRHTNGINLSWQKQESSGGWIPTVGEGISKGASFIIPTAHSHNSGRYACSAGPDSLNRFLIKITVYEPLAVSVIPNPLMLGSGASGNFNCSVRGGRGSGISLSWQHEGRPLHTSLANLAIGPVRPHHAGVYQCTATDQSNSAVSMADFIIADKPPRLISTFSEAVTRIGQSINFRCVATGVPPPRITWTLDDRPLPAAPDKYTINTKAENLPNGGEGAIVSTLSVTIRTSEEGGKYGCNATNFKGSHSHNARLNVFGPPNIRYLPTLHVKTDTDVKLSCPYSGYPIKDVLWKREDGSLVDVMAEANLDRGTLLLSFVKSNIAGGYTCEVRGESGELARRTVRVEVHKPPRLVPFAFPEDIEVGGSTQATCSLISGDKPIQFTWLKDNLPIPVGLKIDQKNMDFFSILIIQELNSAHSGEYTCRAANDFGIVSHSTALMVKEPPTWVWRSQNTTVSAGGSLLLPCSAKGQPTPKITWEISSDGENWRHILWSQTETTDANGGAILSDGTIWIRAVNSEHEGWYRCTARAQHNVIYHSLYLDIREPPRLNRQDGGEISWVIRGSTTRLTCIARGEPEIHLHWTHDSRNLALHDSGSIETRDTGTGAIISELLITHAGPEHAGEYKCHARNLYGTDEVNFRLFVKERPSTPEELRVFEVWSRKAKVSWRISRGSMVSHFTIQYRSLTRDFSLILQEAPVPSIHEGWNAGDSHNLTISSSDLELIPSEGPSRAGAIITGLLPDTRYALRIAAHNDVGVSSYTTPLHFTTREEAPGAAPGDVSVRAQKPRELLITWQPPPRDAWHGTLLGYTIKWCEVSEEGRAVSNDGPITENGASADATSSILRGLKAATRYAVSVSAYNAAGSGPASRTHFRHTLESPPTGSPESVVCVSSGSTSLKVSWKPPPLDLRGGVITHYTLQYTRTDTDPLLPVQDAFLRVQGEETTVSRLTPFAEYEIRVKVINAAGEGPLSSPQFCQTDEDVPSAPGGMKLVALSEKSLRASWLPPPEPNGKLSFYTLYVKDLSGSQEPNESRVNTCTEGDNSSVECMKSVRGLRAGRTYEAWVRASTAAGKGPPSAAVACQTSALAPARISSFGGQAIGAAGGSISLRCVVGGTPPPAKRWLRNGNPLHIRPPFHLDGDALLLRNVDLAHADNYTCVAENPHGSDSVSWRVVVLRPPAPPSLMLIEARPRELELELRPAPRTPGHAPAKAYTLHWRLTEPEPQILQGDWRIQAANPGPVTLSGLRCGSAYRAYASGGGAPGTELTIRTFGGPPINPVDARWIRTNSTHARFDTTLWSDGGCGPVALRLEWAGSGTAGARDVPVGGEVILGGLSPGSRYRVAARASNEAGWVREVYEFSTMPSEDGFAEEVDAPFPATAGELALLLSLCAMLSLAALTILAILLRRKRDDGAPGGQVITNSEKGGCGTYRAPQHQAPKLPPDPPDVYEISPYATFAGPTAAAGSSRAYTLQLRALARHEDDAAPPTNCCDEETCLDDCEGGGQRRRRRRRHYCMEHGKQTPYQGCSQDSGS